MTAASLLGSASRNEPSPEAWRIGRAAVRALYDELALNPKPGLVSPLDNGAHRDMTMATFMRSLFALRSYFPRIAAAGAAGASFEGLRALGLAAERRMLAATGGINTHRGAVFNLGLLAAASGRAAALGIARTPENVCRMVASLWGGGIMGAAPTLPSSNGLRAVNLHGVSGARGQAAAAYPALTGAALPAMRKALAAGASREAGHVQALFAVMAVLDDTNLLHRGGPAGLAFVREAAAAFLGRGGVLADGWRDDALAIHRACIARNLSPGGAADLLAAAIFLHDLADER